MKKNAKYHEGYQHGYSDGILGLNEPLSMEKMPGLKPNEIESYQAGYLDGHKQASIRIHTSLAPRQQDRTDGRERE